MKYFLVIDIGASSGQHIVGWYKNGEMKTREVYRFSNGVQEQAGHLVWDADALYSYVKTGITAEKAGFPGIVSLSIDTWGVDYVLLQGNEEIHPVYAYWDSCTETVIPKVHDILPFSELYAQISCQFQPFNSIYQLCTDTCTSQQERKVCCASMKPSAQRKQSVTTGTSRPRTIMCSAERAWSFR